MKYIKEEENPNIEYRKRPGAYAIMTRSEDNKVGIVTDGRDLFYLGGGIEEGETKLQALKREFIEETGYTIKNIKPFDEVRSFIDGEEKGHLEVEAYVYTAEFDEKVAEPIEKDHKVLWVNPEEYKDKLYREWQKYILREYVENKRKIVIFDWGGVIESHRNGEYSVNKAIVNVIKHFNSKEDEKTIVERYYTQTIEDITYHIYLENDKWFEKIKKEFNLECKPEEFYDYYIKEFDKIEYYKDVVEFAHSLKNKCTVAILSNLGSLDKQRLDKQVDLKEFNYVWLSFELNYRKPKEKIYEIVEKDCKIEPKNILFIDDSKENIEAAKRRGWNTCLATGHELDIIKEKVNEFLD